MNKKKKFSYFLIAAVVLLIIALIFKPDGSDYADDVLEFHEAMNAEGPTATELIDKALEAGELDETTALKYKIFSIYGDSRLPEAFIAEKRDYEDGGALRELMEKWDSLPEETKAELEPFTKRPDEEGNWLELLYTDAPSEEAGLFPKAFAASRPKGSFYKDFLVSKDNKVKIWYLAKDIRAKEVLGTKVVNVSAAVTKKMAEQIKGFLDNDNIMEGFEELMEKKLLEDGTLGGDGKLDIYIIPLDAYGLCRPEGSGVTASHIFIDSGFGTSKPNIMKATVAHEIFHSFQFLFPYKNSDAWWAEATASWAEDFAYPSTNTEHAWIPFYFAYPGTPLYDELPPKNHQYSSYIFAYFMSQNLGDDIIHQSWKHCGEDSCLDTIDGLLEGGFKKQWKEFTLWNLNQTPAVFYKDIPYFPKMTSAAPGNGEFRYIKIKSGNQKIKVDFLNPLSASILSALNHTLKKNIKQITFKNLEQFTKNEGASIKAAIRLRGGGKARIEDWTDKKERKFCIDVPEENIDEIFLIFSNSNKKQWIEESEIEVETSEDTCYRIDQKDEADTVLHLPYGDARSPTIVDVNSPITIASEGDPAEKAAKSAKYAYQTKWEVSYEYNQVRDAFKMDCIVQPGTVDVPAGWVNRDVGVLSFDLSPENVDEKGQFDVDVTMGYPHPEGPYQEVPPVSVNCFAYTAAASQTELPVMTREKAFKGRIFDMTGSGAKIEFLNSCLHNSCSNTDGFEMQTMDEPVILEIKRMGG